jgi:hypothetical protein
MIDICRDHVFPLTELPTRVPARNGRRLHKATGFRWVARGRFGVKLEFILIGGIKHTSLQALQRFCDDVTAAAVGKASSAKRVAAQLDRAGF